VTFFGDQLDFLLEQPELYLLAVFLDARLVEGCGE